MKARPSWMLLLPCLLFGCDYGGGEGAPAANTCGEPREAVIDTGAELEVDPGRGVGLFVEYLGTGEWHLRMTCDTEASSATCHFDVIVWPLGDAELSDFSTEDFDANDVIGFEDDGSLRAVVRTGSDVDGIRFDLTPGAPLRIDALLDGYCAHPYMFWVGEGAIHSGSPSNPVDFIPSE